MVLGALMEDKDYQRKFIEVVTDPRFRVMGFTLPDLLAIRVFLETWGLKVEDLAKIDGAARRG